MVGTVTEVQLLVFEGCDLLDLGGPYEVLLTANRETAGGGPAQPFAVRTVSADGGAVRAYGGIGLEPAGPATPAGGIFLVPGAIDLEPVLGDAQVMDAIRRCGDAADLVASVCTGSLLLGAAGLLEGIPATTHHEDLHLLGEHIGHHNVRDDVRWVDAGGVVTAGGLSSGIAMALHLVARYTTPERAAAVAHRLEYDWDPDAGVTLVAS